MVSVCTGLLGEEGCELLGGYKTKNLYLYHFICICMRVLVANLLKKINTFLSERYVQSSKVFLGC